MAGSTAVSSSATVTPRPRYSASPDGSALPVTAVWLSAAGYAARTGNTPLTSGERSSSATARGSAIAEKPLTTRVNRRSGFAITPFAAIFARNCSWPASTADVQRRSCTSVADPPARRTRSASEGAASSTITRCPSETAVRGVPTRPRHAEGARRGVDVPTLGEPSGTVTAAIVPPTTTTATAAAARLRDSCIGIEREVVAGLERLDPARSRGDHRGVVSGQRERRERGIG